MTRDRFADNLSRLLAGETEVGLSSESERRLTTSIITAWRKSRPVLAPPRDGFELTPVYTALSDRLKSWPLTYFVPAAAGLVGLLYALGGNAALRLILALGGI
jgi:hypothetical protein